MASGFGKTIEDEFMLHNDIRDIAIDPENTRRVVVIGGGTIGVYVAILLASQGKEVVVLEAGDHRLNVFPPDSYASIGRTHRGLELARSRCLGGTSNLWGGQLVEFQPVDFNGRPWLENSRWPVSYDEIAPYYTQTYRNLGVPDQFLGDEKIWQGLSTPSPKLGPDFEVFLTRWMRQPNVAALFQEKVNTDPNLHVVPNMTAIGFRASGSRITGVQVVDAAGNRHVVGGDVFILAAGTVENSRLLLHAATDPNLPCPWRDNQNVGRYFQDHLAKPLGPFKPRDKKTFFNMFCNMVLSGQKFQPKIRMTCEAQNKHQILNIQTSFVFEHSVSEHLVFLKQFLRAAMSGRRHCGFGDFIKNGVGGFKYLIPLMWRYIVDHRIFVPTSANILVGVQAEQVPVADSRITIDPGHRDAYGLPKVLLNWKIGQLEFPSIRKYAQEIKKALADAQIGQMDIYPELESMEPVYLEGMHDTYHQAGGTIMGFGPSDGVVDGDLKVFGTDNLYIGGAGTFKTSSNANVTFTAMTFATRLAKHLAQSSQA